MASEYINPVYSPFSYHCEMCRVLNSSDGLHQGVSDNDLNICSGVALGDVAQLTEVLLVEGGLGVTQMQLEHCLLYTSDAADIYSV